MTLLNDGRPRIQMFIQYKKAKLTQLSRQHRLMVKAQLKFMVKFVSQICATKKIKLRRLDQKVASNQK